MPMLIEDLIATFVQLRGGLDKMSTDEKRALVHLAETAKAQNTKLPSSMQTQNIHFGKTGSKTWNASGIDENGDDHMIGEIRKTGKEFKFKPGDWARTIVEFAELPAMRENSLSAMKKKVRDVVGE